MDKKLKGMSKISLVVALALVIVVPLSAQAANKLIVMGTDGVTNKFVATDDGKIGVGTGAPDSGIHLKGAVYPFASFKAEGNEVSQGGGYLGYMVRTGSLPLANDRLGYFLFGTVNAGTPLHAVGISAIADGAWTTTSTPAYFTFLTTAAGTTSRVERLRIASSGNVGIGTSTPGQKLEVNGGIRLFTATVQPACGTSTRGTIWVTQGASGVKDEVEVCAKDASNNYAWRTIY